MTNNIDLLVFLSLPGPGYLFLLPDLPIPSQQLNAPSNFVQIPSHFVEEMQLTLSLRCCHFK